VSGSHVVRSETVSTRKEAGARIARREKKGRGKVKTWGKRHGEIDRVTSYHNAEIVFGDGAVGIQTERGRGEGEERGEACVIVYFFIGTGSASCDGKGGGGGRGGLTVA